jgi:ferrous iron transport protein B
MNSVGTDGSFGNDNSNNSVLSAVGKAITPVFNPMGIDDDNWPATVGLFTGIFAKEAVVGTLNSLYAQSRNDTALLTEDCSEAIEKKKFDLNAGIKSAFMAIPDGFSGFLKVLTNPLGVGIVVDKLKENDDAIAEELEIEKSTFSAIREHFHSRAAAMAYLLFILIYVPCVAVIATIYRETNMRWTIFAVSYLTGLAWTVATFFYQASRIFISTRTAIPWLLFCICVIVAFVMGLKKVGRQLGEAKYTL